jgi:hypothetical protein
MEVGLVIVIGLGIAVFGAWDVAKHKHARGRLPEDIQ